MSNDTNPTASTRSPRHCYAVWYRYAGAISDGDMLARFSSREDRAEFCERANANMSGSWEPVTAAEIRHRFDPRALAREDVEHLPHVRTASGERIPYTYERPNYRI